MLPILSLYASRSTTIVGAALVLSACFDPTAVDDTDVGTDATGTAGPEATSAPTDGGSNPDDTADDDPSDPDGTTPAGSGSEDEGTDTDPGPACSDDAECSDDLLCILGACAPCTTANDPDIECASADPNMPVCDPSGVCVVCVPSSCEGDTPACDPMVGCMPCTEHWQCPDSACHLSGPAAGSCFDLADVVMVDDGQQLEDEIAGVAEGESRVLRLGPSTYTIPGYPFVSGEIAIIGVPGTVITGAASNLVSVGAPPNALYVSNVRFQNGPLRALYNSGVLWVDDVTITNYPFGLQLSLGSETHIRRSIITATNTAANMFGGVVFAENSTFGPGADFGIAIDDSDLDLRYVTVAGNDAGISCPGPSGGTIRNSIVVGPTAAPIEGACSLSLANTATSGGPGTNVGLYDAGWFVAPAGGDLHLSAAGQAVFAGLAQWAAGDPRFDIDGDPRPQMGTGLPGADETPK